MGKNYLIITIFFAVVGCYTVIKHPELTIRDGESSFTQQVYYNDDCTSCHSGDYAIFGTPYLPRLQYIHQNQRWKEFYQSPWWHRSTFYPSVNQSESEQSGTPLPTTSSRPRFPGQQSDDNATSNTRISGQSGQNPSPTSISVGRDSANSDQEDNSSNQDRQQNSTKTRKSKRGEGSKGSDSDPPRKVEREEE